MQMVKLSKAYKIEETKTEELENEKEWRLS